MIWLLNRLTITGIALAAVADQIEKLHDAVVGWGS